MRLSHREGRGPGLQRLGELYPHIHAGWVGQLELAGVFVHNLLPIEAQERELTETEAAYAALF